MYIIIKDDDFAKEINGVKSEIWGIILIIHELRMCHCRTWPSFLRLVSRIMI
jgi:hypothetical protein